MKKRFLSALICLMIAISTISFTGCGLLQEGDVVEYKPGMSYVVTEKGEALPYYSLSYDIMGGSDVMPIGGFNGLYQYGGSKDGTTTPSLMSEEMFKLCADIGVNMLVYTPDRAENGLEPWLKLGDKYGIGIYANSHTWEMRVGTRVQDYWDDPAYPVPTEEWMYDLIRKFSCDFKYKSFIGIWAMDEPYANHQLVNLGKLSPIFYNCGIPEGIDLYANALGNWKGLSNASNTFTGGGWTYEQYMFTGKQGVVEGVEYNVPGYMTLGFPMLSETAYPITSPEPDYEEFSTFLQDLSQMIKWANECEVPYWRMMQAGYQFYATPPEPYFPEEGQFMLDYNSALAFGAKAIQFFPLMSNEGMSQTNVPGEPDFGKHGLIGIDGKPNQWYYYAQTANKQLQAIDHVLMHSANVGILPHGTQATTMIGELNGELISAKGWRELKSIKGDDIYIGCFDYKGGTALYVVNSSMTEDANAILKFDDKYRYTVTQRGEAIDVVGTSIPLTMSPGEGVMIVLH